MSLRCLILLLMLLASSAQADWVWTPERGWHNPQLEPRGTARELYQQGLELFQEQEYVQAADLFKAWPGSSRDRDTPSGRSSTRARRGSRPERSTRPTRPTRRI
jgi:outer membrane protein assembly factor BamD (BamD/ComL family)